VKKISKNIQTVLGILKNEVDGAVVAAFDKMTDDFSMTWMYQRDDKLFPSTDKNVTREMKEVYSIKGRKYDIRNIVEADNVVIVELVESYPDPEIGKKYRTPLVLVLEMKNGKIKKGRHYCDPRLSSMHLSEKEIDKGLKGTSSKIIVD